MHCVRGWTMTVAALAAGCLAMPALAEGPTYVVKGSGEVQTQFHNVQSASPPQPQVQHRAVTPGQGARAQLVEREVVEPAATVSRGMRQQPTYPDLIEVRVGVLTVMMDPQKDYVHKPYAGSIDANHTLIRAQNLARRPLPQTYVVHGQGYRQPEPAATTTPEPAAVIPVPERMQQPDRTPDPAGPAPKMDPSVEPSPRKIVRSDS